MHYQKKEKKTAWNLNTKKIKACFKFNLICRCIHCWLIQIYISADNADDDVANNNNNDYDDVNDNDKLELECYNYSYESMCVFFLSCLQ